MAFKQYSRYLFSVLLLSTLAIYSCGRQSAGHWSEFLPETTPFVIVPEENATISDLLALPYMPLFDDISPSAIQIAGVLEEDASSPVVIDAMLLYPDSANDWQPVWISRSISGFIEQLTASYQREFEQNQYKFNRHTIQKLFISDRVLFLTEIGDWMIFSESSLGVENILRTLTGISRPMPLASDQVRPGSYIFNTETLETWVHQMAQVSHRPYLDNIFKGGEPVSFQIHEPDTDNLVWQLRGTMELKSEKSSLIRSISSEPASFRLDRFIPVNAASFSIFRLPPMEIPAEFDTENLNDLDNYLANNPDILQSAASQLRNEVAHTTFAESGAESSSEYLFLRAIRSGSEIRALFDRLYNEELLFKDQNTYSLQSNLLGKLLGSELNPMTDLHISVYDEVLAIAQRKGLAESVGGDASRRMVMYYDDEYSGILNSLGGPLSSITFIDASRFGRFIQPWLYPQNYFNSLISDLDRVVITTALQSNQSTLDVNISSFQQETPDRPFREQWVFPLDGAEITGPAVLTDLTGSARDEVIFSTDNGNVYALASDGTMVLQASTDGDEPVGPPIVYDWYGNDQYVIMQAAGDKIYAWNNEGALLPNFPVILTDRATSPLSVMDVTRNGVAEMVIATADRRVHILNARGQAINGWPQSTNSSVQFQPLITELDGQRSLFALAENTLHGWNVNGERRSGFPVFLNSQMAGAPYRFQDHLLGSGLDGRLYSVGINPLFNDTLSTSHQSDSLQVQSVLVSNSSLNSTPSSQSMLMRDNGGDFFREELILVQSQNGSLFMYNENGLLRFTKTLGQPVSDRFPPFIGDIDRNQRMDIIALADFGRLYAWDFISGDRIIDLPTTGMRHLVITDLFRDGNNEIIAATRDGLRCWTIFRTRREASD